MYKMILKKNIKIVFLPIIIFLNVKEKLQRFIF